MRVLVGWLLLFGLVAAMAWITAEKRMSAREHRAQITSELAPEAPGIPARVLIGAPSGAEPFGSSRKTVGRAERRFVSTEPVPEPVQTEPSPKIFKLVVRPGNALSTICQKFYTEEDRPPLAELVEAVASWNQLTSPDSLKVGQNLELPPMELLFKE